MEIKELLQQRKVEYGPSWWITGTLLTPIRKELEELLHVFPEAWFPWIIIWNKLTRALASPKNPDHWRDIAGYATLVLQFLEKEEANDHSA